MRGFKFFPALVAMALTTALFISPALAEAPPSEPTLTPIPQTGVRIVLPSGKIIILSVEHDTPMAPGANQDHIVGEELC